MLIIAQSMFLAVAACGLAMFLYLHLFTYRRLRHHERVVDRQESRAERIAETVGTAPQSALALVDPQQAEAHLFTLYQEQIRRFIDAKIDIMRSAAETQNRILLLQAQHSFTLPSPVAAVGPETIDAALPVIAERGMMNDQLRVAREVTERHLAQIEEQIRSLPGPNIEQWVNLQQQHAA